MKTTKKDFDLFKSECEYWIDKLKLDDWEAYIHHENPDDKYADCSCNQDTIFKRADIKFSISHFDKDTFNEEYIKRVAKHEVLHILLATITDLAHNRFLRRDELVKAEEELIRKLEKIIK